MAKIQHGKSTERRIRQYEEGSEILVTYVQLGIILLIAIFYTIAPKGGAENVLFQPVPYALTIWLVVLICRYILAYKRKMHGFLVYFFIVIDVVLLLLLIWSYSTQYQAPIALSLKAPTFIFLLFFIFLRALRFQLRYVVAGYVVAVIGWVALVFLAYREGAVTHDFLEYATSNRLLVGAEVEKLIGLSVCTLVICLAVKRSEQVLILSNQQKDVMQNLSLFFSQNVVQRIAAEDEIIHPGKGEERTGAIMSIDIRGFTKFSSEHSAEAVMHTISEYQARLVPAIQDNFGSIDKFIGDGILLHFGIADDSPHYVANAFRAAEAIIDTMHAWNKERVADGIETIDVGVGIDVGQVIFGTVGNETRLDFTIIGNAVNMASKLEKATKHYPGQILGTKVALDLAKKQQYKPRYTPFLVKRKNTAAGVLPDIVNLLNRQQKKDAQV